MPNVSLNNYISWANTQRRDSSRVVLADTPAGASNTLLQRASTRLGVIFRAFHTSRSQDMAAAVNSDFRDALAAKFGDRIAREALAATVDRHFLTGYSTEKLTAGGIKKAVGAATCMAARLDSVGMQAPPAPISIRTALREELEARLQGLRPSEVSRSEQRARVQANALNEMADALIESYPMTPDGLEKLNAMAEDMERMAGALKEQLKQMPLGASARSEMNRDIDAAVSRAKGHCASMKDLQDHHPMTMSKITHAKKLWIESARQCAMKVADSGKRSPETTDALKDLSAEGGFFKALTEAVDTGITGETQWKLLSTFGADRGTELLDLIRDFGPVRAARPADETQRCDNIKKHLGDIEEKLESLIRKAVQTVTESKHGRRLDLEDGIVEELEGVLNRGPWDPIRKEFDSSIGGKQVKVHSNLTPAKHLGYEMEKVYDGVGGIMSHGFASERAVNLLSTELTLTDSSGRETVAFRGVRHGVNSAVDIEDKKAFRKANEARARQTAMTAFLSRQDLIAQAFSADNPDHTVDFNMTSVGLLTPDSIRHKLRWAPKLIGGKHADEVPMIRGQIRGWADLEDTIRKDGGIKMTVEDPNNKGSFAEVTIRPNIIALDYGVNKGSVGYGGLGLMGGWGMLDSINKVGMERLKARVDSFLAGCQDAKKADNVRMLWGQINNILDSRAERHDRGDAYKLTSRLTVMTYLMGDIPCWNCKSGKDRTGQMDVESKFLAALIAADQPIPDPGAELTAEQKTLFRDIALLGGNHELQEYNTGVAGYKLNGVDSVTERLGGSEYKDFHVGASKYAHS